MAKKTDKVPFNFKVGDWCKSYEKGFFRIEKIVPMIIGEWEINRERLIALASQEGEKEYQPRYTPDMLGQPRGRMVLSKRLLNSKFKKQVGGGDCCGEEFIKPLKPEEREQLEKFIQENPKVMADFEKSVPKYPELRYGFDFELSREGLSEKIAEMKAEGKKRGDPAIALSALPINEDTEKLLRIAEEVQQTPLTTKEVLDRIQEYGLYPKMVHRGNVMVQGVSRGEFREGQIVFSQLILHGFNLAKELGGDLSID